MMILQELLQINEESLSDYRVSKPDHFGAKSDKPDAYKQLQKVLVLLNKKLPIDKLYALSSKDERRFKKKMNSLGLKADAAEKPTVADLLAVDFVKAGRLANGQFFSKNDCIVVISDEAPPTVFF